MFSEPAVGEKFFGREEVLELLTKRASALKDGYRQNIALTGQSLAGKSSIILHFLHTIRDEGFVPVYVEVVKESFRSFANKFIATLLYNALVKIGRQSSVEMDDIIEKSREALPKTSAAIKAVNSFIERGALDDAYINLLGLTSVLKDEAGLSCIVMLDEFDNLELVGIKNPFLGFGKIIMVQKDTMYIVSSSRNEAIKKIISEKLSLLFGNFEVVNVSNFNLKTASEFIDVKLAGFEVDDVIKRFLILFTDGNPFYLDKITSRAKEAALGRMKSYIDKEEVEEAILDLIYNAGGSICQYLSNYLLELLDTKQKDVLMAMLCAIASGQNKKSEISRALKARHVDIMKGLARLIDLGLISKNGVFYMIDDMMLEFWLKHVYQRRKGLLIDGTFNKMALFAGDVKTYLSDFTEELNKPVTARAAELFNLFSNELVQMESRHLKLPHFTKVEVKKGQNSEAFIAASFRGNSWIVQVYETAVTENDIINYVKTVKALENKISNKIIVPLKGIDENAKLLAKELKISIWELPGLNRLMKLYGKKGVIVL